jgi:uncharacterized protein involved in outer membrane biogenesis
MKAIKVLAVVLLALLLIAFALPLVLPLKSYIPTLEKLAGEGLGEPVTIGALKVRLLPVPVAVVEDIRIGTAQEVHIGSVRVYPDPWTLTAPVKVLRRVEVDGVVVDRALLSRLSRFARQKATPPQVALRRLEISNARLVMGDWQWGPLRLAADFDARGPNRVEAGQADQSLTLVLTPQGEHYDLTLAGHNWTLPAKPALRFDDLRGTGRLEGDRLELALDGRLYGGDLRLNGTVAWQEGVRIKGEAKVAEVEIGPLVRLVSPSTGLSGLIFGSGPFALASADAGHLADSLRASFRFEVKRGVLSGFDLAGAVRALAGQGTRGGQTSFNEFTGLLNITGRHIALRELRIASGLLQANGELDILPSRKLSGRAKVEMKGTASLVSVPLEVGGTLDDPVLFPNRAALAGAAVGTGLLGPGLGTTVGAKAGEAPDKLLR